VPLLPQNTANTLILPFLLFLPLQVPGRGPYCFKIHGQTYHSTTTLHPSEGQERRYGQLYIIEGDQAVTTRMSAAPNSQCLRSVMETINTVMEEHSPYVSAFKQMHTVEQEEEQHAADQDQEARTVRLFFKRGPDCRRYNEPTHNEIAAVFVGEDGAPPANRDIVVYPRDRPPERMPYISCHVDPMCYPLLFPRGDLGWHDSMQHVLEFRTATRNRLTTHIKMTSLLQSCHKVVDNLVSELSQPCDNLVTSLSQGCHKVVTGLSQGCHKVVTWLSHGCE